MKLKKKKIRKIYFAIRLIVTIIVVIIIITLLGVWQIDKKELNTQPSPTPSALYQDFHLSVPVLGIEAPIISDVNGTNQKEYDKALENGVAQLKGSSKPGGGSNIFIFGHSSYYLWAPGEYKNIFSNLDELKKDDEIIIWYQNKEYKYIVTETNIISPYKVNIASPTQNEQVTLMTCWPRFTTQKRLVVIATLKKD